MHADPSRIRLSHLDEANERIGDKGIILASIYSPIDCRNVLRPDDFMMLYYDDPLAFREVVEIGAEAMLR